jgi:hypothetical protein
MTSGDTSQFRERQYWVVSPNVKDDNSTVGEWREASVREHAAFMGWEPDDSHHSDGPKFAGLTERGVMPGDVILIARRFHREPEIVGFGVVRGKYAKTLKGFVSPKRQEFGSLRKLSPFIPWSGSPSDVPLMDVLRHTRAMVQLHPEWNEAHNSVCRWMDHHLGKGSAIEGNAGARRAPTPPNTDLVDLPETYQLDYEFQTKSRIARAKRIEAELLNGYRDWLAKQDRILSAAKYGALRCDGYEKKRRNLIEAKSSSRRENIRMAVGQLLDYAFMGERKFGKPNKAILLPERPHSEIEEWLLSIKISIVWREQGSYFDNANGLFA